MACAQCAKLISVLELMKLEIDSSPSPPVGVYIPMFIGVINGLIRKTLQECEKPDTSLSDKLDTILAMLGYEEEPRWVGNCMDCKEYQAIDHKTGRCGLLQEMVEEEPGPYAPRTIVTRRYFGCIAFEKVDE